MIYRHTDDIDLSANYDRAEADEKLLPAVHLTIRDLEKHTSLDADFRSVCAGQLKVFLSSYRSIVLLLGREKEDPLLGADALSLGREQIEKVFAISLLCEEPVRWAKTYLENAWVTWFERYLIEKAERQSLPRWQGFFQKAYTSIEGMRKRLGIVDDVRDLVEYRFFNRQDPPSGRPKHLVGVSRPEAFPTPGGVLNKVSGPKKDFLERWYREYRFFCDFTHVGMGKLEMTNIYDPGSGYTSVERGEFYDKEVQNAVAVSYVATASACTELIEVLGSGDVDRILRLGELWDFLRPRFLLAKAMRGLRAQHLLPPVLST